jgi:kynurenine formamidase
MCNKMLRKITFGFMIVSVAVALTIFTSGRSKAVDVSMYEVVDLSHPINSGMVRFPGDAPVLVTPKKGSGENAPYLYDISMPDRSGTHVVVPSRWNAIYSTADRVPPDFLISNAVVLNVRDAAAKDPDYLLDSGQIMRWEVFNDTIPSGSVVLVETGWSQHWGDETIYFNFDKNKRMHFPGVSLDAVKFLMEKRGVKVIGIDTPGLDPGFSRKFEAARFMADSGGIVLLNLRNLKKLTPTGSAVFIGLLPLSVGGGSPARILGLIPKGKK